MGSVRHEVSALRGPASRWAGLALMVVLAGCGGDREASPAGDGSSVATADTSAARATPAPADTAGTTRPAGADTGSARADTVAAAKRPASDTAAPPSKPAAPASKPKPAAAPKPASTPKPAPASEPAPAPEPATPAPSEDTAASQDTATPAQDTGSAQQPAQESPQETATEPLRDAYHQAPKDTVDQATYNGWKQYNLNCARCHGEDVLGSTIAPHLIMSLKPDGPIPTQEAFTQVVCAGRPEKGMPSWCALGMEPAKINEIYAYVKGRSEAKLGPGRPALREGS